MSDYDTYFSTRSIIRGLCQIRLGRARSVHERRFLRKIFELGPEDGASSINRLLPPRREWSRFRPRKAARSESDDATQISLERCVSWHQRQSTKPDWLCRLENLVGSVRERVLVQSNFQFNSPSITAQHKGGHDYRAIASFSRIEDKIVDILNAKYLREKLDICFEDSSVAFRGKRKNPLNRDTAIDQIFRIRREHQNLPLYVTECDIRGFFDCVHHKVAKKSLRDAERILETREPEVRIDPRSVKVFDAYLACYNFSHTVLSKERELKLKVDDPLAVYKWPLSSRSMPPIPDCLEYFHKKPKQARIGVPQGGAHSCLIANLILDLADKEVCLELFRSPVPSIYLRYCDDIIIVSSAKSACDAATERYKKCLEVLKLPFHQPVPLSGSKRQFYNDSKTKECYVWGANTKDLEFPWVQFLGYQIRHDCLIRVRPSSIAKHKSKSDTLRESICSELKERKAKVSAKRVLHRFNSKVWAFSTGRVNPSQPCGKPLPMCWASGFRQLAKRDFMTSRIRELDRHVGRNRKRLKRFLKKSNTGAVTELRNKRHLRYFGAPFSHLRQFRPARSTANSE